MEWTVKKKREVAGSYLLVSAGKIGADILLCVEQAVPRPSLRGDGSGSATSSVLNLTGHKDEYLCRKLAEHVCRSLGTVVVCTGGFHLDGISEKQIEEVMKTAEELAEEIVSLLD